MTAVIAGAGGGAVAIALMELLSERAASPLMLVPFATSIVLVMGSPEIEAAQPRPLIGGHVVSTVVRGGAGGRPGYGGDASHQDLSPAGRNRSPRRRAQRHVLEFSPRPGGGRSMPAGRLGLRLAQPFPRRRLARAVVVIRSRPSGRWRYSAAGSSAASRNRLSSPSRSSTRPRRWKAASVERWPIDTIVVRLRRVLRRR